jgi:hypothetical protein
MDMRGGAGMKMTGRLIGFLSSLPLAVVTMAALAAVCTAATIHESKFGTPAAQRA